MNTMQPKKTNRIRAQKDLLLCYTPCFIPAQTLDIHQYSYELRDAECWMCVIHLHCDLSRKISPIHKVSWSLLKVCNNILKGSRAQCVLLLQSKCLSLQCFITRVKNVTYLLIDKSPDKIISHKLTGFLLL